MKRRRFKLNINHNSEFELDLAPLLAVMVKLVPVLLLSSAFVQMMIIESELPQVVQQAIQEQNKDDKATKISLEINKTDGVKIVIQSNNEEKTEVVANKNNAIDLDSLHAKLIEVKKNNPQIFKIDISPDSDISYKDVVGIMDQARKSKSNTIQFKFTDTQTGKETSTDYMFPEVVFSNVMDG
jgi:biopolymer transport protein ExbD